MSTPKTPARKRAAKPRRQASETLHFNDVDRVRALAGAGDRFLILIEEELDVRLSAPGGGQIVISADAPDAREEAKRVLKRLYASLEHGLTCDEAAVRAALRSRQDEVEGAEDDGVIRVPRGSSLIARTEGQRTYVRALKNTRKYDLIFGVGPAGTGKTLLAVAYGASLLVQRKVEKLIITRPAVEAGEKLGFLPGDLTEKVDPYLLPVWDALADTLGRSQLEKIREDGRIEVAPIAFMRGRTLNRAFIVVDEAQNTSRAQMQMVLTRLGEGSRMAVTGDPSQCDLHPRDPSGLPHALSILAKTEGVAIVRFGRGDVVRHDLVARIVAAYEEDAGISPGVEAE
ncbi:PhoH family protein [Maricaulis sp.]|uniref:PhoH family protein n=1 Tax=Maricaulis sp. TaxID=1486257 RepID=UPI00262B406C|nr:PhoH family protein [Maricaulis sp.]